MPEKAMCDYCNQEFQFTHSETQTGSIFSSTQYFLEGAGKVGSKAEYHRSGLVEIQCTECEEHDLEQALDEIGGEA